jgi:hypothetical protein
VLLVYAAGRLLLLKREIGLLAAFLLAISVFHVQYSQEARMYALAALLALASVCCFVLVLTGRSPAAWAGYLAATLLLVYTHPSGWALVAVQNLAVIVRRTVRGAPARPSLPAWFAGQALMLVLYSPWIVALATHDSGLSLSGGFSLHKLRRSLKDHAGGYLLLTAFLAAIAFGLVARLRAGNVDRRAGNGSPLVVWISRHGRTLFALSWWLGPLAALAVASLVLGVRIRDRYTMVGLPAMFLLAAAGASALPRRPLKIAAAGLFAVLSVWPLVDYLGTPRKEDWRGVVGAVRFVARTAKRDEPVLLVMFRAKWYARACFDYYAGESGLLRFKIPEDTEPFENRTRKCLGARARKYPRCWVLLRDSEGWDRDLRLMRRAGYKSKSDLRFRGFRLLRYRRPPGAPPDKTRNRG